MLRVRAPKDFLAGLLFIAVGGVGAALALSYPFGRATRMGPGYLPSVLSWATILCGATVFLRSFTIDGTAVSALMWRPLVLVLASIVVFGLSIDKAGFILTAVATSLVGGFASPDIGRLESILLAIGMAAFCAVVFIYGLGQPLDLRPRRWSCSPTSPSASARRFRFQIWASACLGPCSAR